MRTRWFTVTEDGWFRSTNRVPRNLREAWSKTLEKWRLMASGYHTWYASDTCGLCNMYRDRKSYTVKVICFKCPIYKITGKHGCNGNRPLLKLQKIFDTNASADYRKTAEEELIWLRNLKKQTTGG